MITSYRTLDPGFDITRKKNKELDKRRCFLFDVITVEFVITRRK
jgi:hypothetical protein